jgi:hypothetical protein
VVLGFWQPERRAAGKDPASKKVGYSGRLVGLNEANVMLTYNPTFGLFQNALLPDPPDASYSYSESFSVASCCQLGAPHLFW